MENPRPLNHECCPTLPLQKNEKSQQSNFFLSSKRKIENKNKNRAAAATTSALTHKRKSDRNIQTREQRYDPKFKTKQGLFEKEGDRETKGSQTKQLRNKSPHPPSFPTTSHPKPFSDKAKPHKEKMKRQKS
jgi:hypothetical protein